MTNDALIKSLFERLDEPQAHYATLESYYAGTQPLSFLSPEAREALGSSRDPASSPARRRRYRSSTATWAFEFCRSSSVPHRGLTTRIRLAHGTCSSSS